MDKILTYKGAVMTWECDSNRHMNVMYYINKFENAGRNFMLDIGLVEVMDQHEHMGSVALEQVVKYHKEVFEDDILYVESQLLDISNKAFTIFHEMYNGSTRALVSTMKVVVVLFDKKERKALVFPTKLKTELLSKIKK